jgi:4-pyridoxate dehydrogenase
VHGVTFDGDRAAGVTFSCNAKVQSVRAEREVLLAGGAINSPQLLMLSGIGDPARLRAQGIDVRVPVPNVGRNLQDHICCMVVYSRNAPGPLHHAMRVDRLVRTLGEAYFLGRGLATALPVADMAFVRTVHAADLPDVQLLFMAAPITAGPYLMPVVKPYVDGFITRVVLLRPESRGCVELASANAASLAIIRQNFLTRDKDWKVLREGLRIAQRIGQLRPLADFVAARIAPADNSDQGLDAHIRASAITVHHPAGTCRMGGDRDPDRVVDQELRVIGTTGLRIIDASVMPDLVGGNINAAVIMIAEKASDMIRGR